VSGTVLAAGAPGAVAGGVGVVGWFQFISNTLLVAVLYCCSYSQYFG